MRLSDYRLLPQREQLDLLYKWGVYIGKRKQAGTTVLLYQLDGFYVEIFYSRYRQFVSGIRSFGSTYRLDPYLDQIDVESLVNI